MFPDMALTATPKQGEFSAPEVVEIDFLESPFLRWIRLADSLLQKPREEHDAAELSN